MQIPRTERARAGKKVVAPLAVEALSELVGEARPGTLEIPVSFAFIGKEDSELARSLENSATALRGAGYEVSAELLAGDPDEAIAEKVKESGSDLLVMGAYGHSRVRQFILGSTTTHLVRTCHIPVLLFR